MRLYLDTEFNGFGGQLISLALVSDDDRFWYGVLRLPAAVDPWVNENVVPVLNSSAMEVEDFRQSLHGFLGEFTNPTIVADWYTDLAHFFNQFAGNDHSESLDYPCRALLLSIPNVESELPHNALADAFALREAARALV